MNGLIDLGTSVSAAKSAPAPVSKKRKPVEAPMIRMTRNGDPGRIFGDYNSIDAMESEGSKIAKLEMWIAKRVGSALVNKYPRREWGVKVNIPGQMVIVMCPSLSQKNGYHIKMMGMTVHDLAARAVKAGGEILERYNLSRERRFDPDQIETLDRTVDDEVISSDAIPEARV